MNTKEFIKEQWVVVPALWRKYPSWQSSIDDHAAFGAVFPTIRGVGADVVPPCRALPIAASAACQFQSTLANSSHSPISSAMIPRLTVSNPAPNPTSQLFHRQSRSTVWPIGILSAQGMPAQNPSAARNEAESPDSL